MEEALRTGRPVGTGIGLAFCAGRSQRGAISAWFKRGWHFGIWHLRLNDTVAPQIHLIHVYNDLHQFALFMAPVYNFLA
jgi:hypothetical protein